MSPLGEGSSRVQQNSSCPVCLSDAVIKDQAESPAPPPLVFINKVIDGELIGAKSVSVLQKQLKPIRFRIPLRLPRDLQDERVDKRMQMHKAGIN